MWFILSGFHGLVEPEDFLEPYDKDLNKATPREQRAWAMGVLQQIQRKLGDLAEIRFELLAGNAYCGHGLIKGLLAMGAKVEWPVQGMGRFEQGAYYARRAKGRAKKRELSSAPFSPTYLPIFEHFQSIQEDTVLLRFEEIEAILGRPLPPSARRHQAWWSGSVAPSAWRAAGWTLEKVDRNREVATFIRLDRVAKGVPPASIGSLAINSGLDANLVDEAVAFLTDPKNAEPAGDFPSRRQNIEQPGLYSWWCDEAGRSHVASGLGFSIEQPLIYAGQAGADTNADLDQRILKTHLAGKISRSTFRLTLTAVLRRELNLELESGELTPGSHNLLTQWMKHHLSIAVLPYDDRRSLMTLEDVVIRRINAPLNLQKMRKNALRSKLSLLRKEIVEGSPPDGNGKG